VRNLKMTMEYDGTDYSGWQIQPRLRTVQGVLTEALSTLTCEKITLTGAGRTDAGVHAYGQVANFRTANRMKAESLRKSLNSVLPKDIHIREMSEVPSGFNSRYDARSKVYEYRVLCGTSPLRRHYTWQTKYALDLECMNGSAQYLLGLHDLSSFTVEPKGDSMVHVLGVGWRTVEDELVFRVQADRFLNRLVRMMVGRMVEIGRGRFDPEVMAELIEKKKKGAATPTAPAHGLYLVRVNY